MAESIDHVVGKLQFSVTEDHVRVTMADTVETVPRQLWEQLCEFFQNEWQRIEDAPSYTDAGRDNYAAAAERVWDERKHKGAMP